MPVFVRESGVSVEVIRPRPRRAEMPVGVRRRLARDAAMWALRRQGWAFASIAEAFSLTDRQVRNRIRELERALAGDRGEAEA